VIGVVVVRDGVTGAGAHEVAAVATEVWVVGSGVPSAAAPPGTTRAVELGAYAPAAWAAWLDTQLGDHGAVLSSEPDGRDLAARLAAVRDVGLIAGCLDLTGADAIVPRFGGATTERIALTHRCVLTVQSHTTVTDASPVTCPVEHVTVDDDRDAVSLGELPREAGAADLASASRVVAGGAGLTVPGDFDVLADLARHLDAALGATRVATDRHWAAPDRQIGTTGIAISPALYLAFGISGAVQHTAGIGRPAHIVSVNTDPGCPMSQLADLAIVADAPATIAALVGLTAP
jgi:electron transfer flavoprotein alpha subunit